MNKKQPFNPNAAFEASMTDKRKFGAGVSARDPLSPPADQFSENGIIIKSLPTHLYTPNGADTVDARNLDTIAIGARKEILRIVCPNGRQMMFTGYAIFNDALNFDDVEFIPRINGARILQFHGFPKPNGSYKIALGLGPDLNNSSLIECQQSLLPGQVLTWEAINNAAVAVVMGVRMKGYSGSGLIRREKTGG